MSVRSWYTQIVSGTPEISESTQYTHSGGSSLKLAGAAGSIIKLYQEIFLTDDVYTFSIYVMSALAQTGAQVQLQIREYDEDQDGNPALTGNLYFSATLNSDIPIDSWGRKEVEVPLVGIGDHCILVLTLTSGSNPIYIDDVMLNRGNVAFPYTPHIADYFYSEDILTEVPPQEYLGSYTISKNQLYKNLDTSRYYLRLGVQLDPSITPVLVTDDIQDLYGQGAIPGDPWPQNIIDNTLLDTNWREYGDNRVVVFPSGFDPYALLPENFPFHLWFKSSASVVLNGSLLAEGSVNADSINVFNLSALSADIGEVSAGVLRSPDWTVQSTTGSKIDLTNGTLQLGGGGVGTPKLLFDGTNLIFGDGAIMWNNLDAQSQANLEGPMGPAGADGADGADGATGPQGPPGPQGDPGEDGTGVAIQVDWNNGNFLLLNVGMSDETQVANYSPGTTTFTVTLRGQTGTISSSGFSSNLTDVPLQDGVPFPWSVQAASGGATYPYITAANGIAGFTVTGTITGATFHPVTRLARVKGTYISSGGIYTGNLTADRILSGGITLSRLDNYWPYIKAGKADYASTTAGFFLGLDTDSWWKFHIGNSTNWFKWTGTELSTRGWFSILLNNGSTGRIVSIGKRLNPSAFNTSPGSIIDSNFLADETTNWYSYTSSTGWTRLLRIAEDNSVSRYSLDNFIIRTSMYETSSDGKALDIGFSVAELNQTDFGTILMVEGGTYADYVMMYGPRRITSNAYDRTTSGMINDGATQFATTAAAPTGIYPAMCVFTDVVTRKCVWARATSASGTTVYIDSIDTYDAGLSSIASGSNVRFMYSSFYPPTKGGFFSNYLPTAFNDAIHIEADYPYNNCGVQGSCEYRKGAGVAGFGHNGYGGYFDGDIGAIVLAITNTGTPVAGTYPQGTIYHQSGGGLWLYSTIGGSAGWRYLGPA